MSSDNLEWLCVQRALSVGSYLEHYAVIFTRIIRYIVVGSFGHVSSSFVSAFIVLFLLFDADLGGQTYNHTDRSTTKCTTCCDTWTLAYAFM